MVNAAAQTEPSLPATVIGIEQDALIGVRVRKSFGSRVFWGSVVGCYWISGGLFYKVAFDDGDVDIFSCDEVVQDAMAAKKHSNEKNSNRSEKENSSSDNEKALASYFAMMKQHKLKRKRDHEVDLLAFRTRRVYLWGQRLYASIYTNMKNETFIKEMLKTEDGEMGEIEATGQVQVGDMILAVNGTRVLGMSSKDLAELIRKPKRPIVLTLYRPHPSQFSSLQQQRAQNHALAASNVSTTTPPLPQQSTQSSSQAQAVPTTPYATMNPIQQSPAAAIASSPFVVPSATFNHSPVIANQWMNNVITSQPQTLSIKEKFRQNLVQKVAARQAKNPIPGYTKDMFGNVVSVGGMSFTQGSMYQPHQIQYMQNVVNAAAMRVATQPSAAVTQQGRAAQFPLTSVPRNLLNGGKAHELVVQQMDAVHGTSRPPSQPTVAITEPSSSLSVTSSVTLDEQSLSLERERIQAEKLVTRQQVSTSAENTLDDLTTSPSTLGSLTPAGDTEIRTADGVETIARQGKGKDQENVVMTSETAVATSFVSPTDAVESSRADATEETSIKLEIADSMSFLSPTDFNVESSMLSTAAASPATQKRAHIESNVSVVKVNVSRRRLYLTLGIQGTLIAVTSFVKDEFGHPGEVEASGKVLLGDVLVRINETPLVSGLTPSHVAAIVSRSPRPLTLWFERASWDILDGKA